MSASKASNAILAKARAMYGRRLTDNDYGQLIDCKSVPEVAAYLKSRTSYAHALTGLNENDIHRGQLEPVLRQDLYFDIFSLSRYATQNAAYFSEFISRNAFSLLPARIVKIPPPLPPNCDCTRGKYGLVSSAG